jgi:hypothetical protein
MAQNTKNSTTLFGNGIRKEFTRAITKSERVPRGGMGSSYAITLGLARQIKLRNSVMVARMPLTHEV